MGICRGVYLRHDSGLHGPFSPPAEEDEVVVVGGGMDWTAWRSPRARATGRAPAPLTRPVRGRVKACPCCTASKAAAASTTSGALIVTIMMHALCGGVYGVWRDERGLVEGGQDGGWRAGIVHGRRQKKGAPLSNL